MTVPADGPAGDQIEPFATRQFEFLRSLERYGSAVWIDLGGTPTLVLYNLETIHRVFGDKLVHVDMPPLSRRLQTVTGSGLLTNFHWPTWHPRRRLIVKPVGARAVGRFAARMASIIDEELNGWPVDEEFELRDRVHTTTLRVVADLLFSESLTAEAIDVVGRIVEELHAWSESDPANQNVTEPPAAFREALADVDSYIGSAGRLDHRGRRGGCSRGRVCAGSRRRQAAAGGSACPRPAARLPVTWPNRCRSRSSLRWWRPTPAGCSKPGRPWLPRLVRECP